MFKSIKTNSSLSEKIEEVIEEAIRSGILKTGMKLPTEQELCQQFSVSRTAVREAIQKLSARGMIEVHKGSGTYVSEISMNQARQALDLFFELSTQNNLIADTIQARKMIEPNIAAHAAKVRTKQHIDLLSQNLEQLVACDLEDLEQEAELDNAFHSTIIQAADNSVLELLMYPVYTLIPKYRKLIFAKSSELMFAEQKKSTN